MNRYRNAGIFAQFREKDLEHDFKVNDDNQEAMDLIWERIGKLPDLGARGVLLMGPTGTGKSLLANLYAKRAVDVGVKTYVIAFAEYLDMHRKLITLENLFNKTEDRDVYDELVAKMNLVRDCRSKITLLVVDDIGKEYGTDSGWAKYQLDQLLRGRWNRGLTTVITTNHREENWEKDFSASVASLVHEACDIVSMVGEDWRR